MLPGYNVSSETDGPMYTVPLPFRTRRLWPSCDGLIVEKADTVAQHNTLMHGRSCPSMVPRAMSAPDNADSGGGDEELPRLFSLLHPLEDVRPLQFAPATAATACSGSGGDEASEGGGGGGGGGVDQQVLFCSTQVSAPLLVTLREATRELCVWVMRQRQVPLYTAAAPAGAGELPPQPQGQADRADMSTGMEEEEEEGEQEEEEVEAPLRLLEAAVAAASLPSGTTRPRPR